MINAERLVRKIVADTQLPTFTDNAIKSKIHSVYGKYTSVYSDQYWTVPNDIIKGIHGTISNVAVIETEYDRKQPPTYKRWYLLGGFITPTGVKRALWITITASGAGSVEQPLDKYDVVVTTETLAPKQMHSKGQEHLKDIGVL